MKIFPPNNTGVIEPFQMHLSKKNPGSEWMFSGWISTQFSVQQLKTRTENEIVRGASIANLQINPWKPSFFNSQISHYDTLPSTQTMQLSTLLRLELTLSNNCS